MASVMHSRSMTLLRLTLASMRTDACCFSVEADDDCLTGVWSAGVLVLRTAVD